MSCNIKLALSKPSVEIISKAKTAIVSKGGIFSGDTTRGSFSVSVGVGTVAADYSITNEEIEIVVTKKSFIVSCKRIEDFLKQQLM